MGSLRDLLRKKPVRAIKKVRAKAREVMLRTLGQINHLNNYYNPYIDKRPGALIEILSKEGREALQKLTPEELGKLRVDKQLLKGPPKGDEWIRRRKLELDKKFK